MDKDVQVSFSKIAATGLMVKYLTADAQDECDGGGFEVLSFHVEGAWVCCCTKVGFAGLAKQSE